MMYTKDKIDCFNIEGKNLVLDCVLVDFNGIPIFFVCKDEANFYIAECYDIDEYKYYVAWIDAEDLISMLSREKSMSDLILSGKKIWDVSTGDDMGTDSTTEISSLEVSVDNLPPQNAFYDIVDDAVKLYLEDICAQHNNYTSNDIELGHGELNFEYYQSRIFITHKLSSTDDGSKKASIYIELSRDAVNSTQMHQMKKSKKASYNRKMVCFIKAA